MKNLFYFSSARFLKSVITKNLFALLTLIFLILPQYACSPTEPPDIKPPVVEPDSTTQNFTFETYEFGDGFESSWLNDVWIFDENNIWAVGYINSTSNTGRVNIIKWNGNKWLGIGRQFNSAGIDGIWAKDTSNIYFATGIVLKYKNGMFTWEDFSQLEFDQGQAVHKLWGSSESNIWGVGPNGTIVHYDGTNWSKIDFDINYRFDAITGSKQTGIAYASATSPEFNTIIVELKDNTTNVIYNSANDLNSLSSFNLELLDEKTLLLGRTKIWNFNLDTKGTKTLLFLNYGYSVMNMAVYSPIDIYYFVDKYGSGMELLHYNGKRYKEITFSNDINHIQGGSYAIKDLAVMTGFSNNKGYLVKVKRIK